MTKNNCLAFGVLCLRGRRERESESIQSFPNLVRSPLLSLKTVLKMRRGG